jgi:hypothetical protein
LIKFQTQFRDVVAVWFAWIAVFIFWLIYLFSDSITESVFNREKFTDNIWTAWSLYSIATLAHEEFFTKLSRMTVILIQWSIQAFIIAILIGSLYGTGPAIIVWAAIVAWVLTLPFPFIWGNLFLYRVTQKHILKYQAQKKMIGTTNKDKLKDYSDRIDVFNEKTFGYYHWYYCLAFIIFWICWPFAISRLQSLPRTAFDYNWFWYSSLYSGWPQWV